MATEIPRPGFIKNLIITGKFNQLIVYTCNGISIGVLLSLALLVQLDIISPLEFWNELIKKYVSIGTPVDFLIFAALSGTGIYGTYIFIYMRKIRRIDTIFHDFAPTVVLCL